MNDNRNYTPAGQPVTQPLYNGQPVYTAPQNPAPVQNPTPVYTYPPQGGNGAPVYAQPVQRPVYYAPVQTPVGGPRAFGAKGAAPRGLPPFVCDHDLFADTGFVDDACNADFNGVRREFDGAEHHWRLSPTAYYLISSIASFLSIVLPFSFFCSWEKKALGHGACGVKRCAEQMFCSSLRACCQCVLMNIPANLISQLEGSARLNGDANTADAWR